MSVFSVDQTTGALTALSGSPFATALYRSSVAFSPGLLAVANGDDSKCVDIFDGAAAERID